MEFRSQLFRDWAERKALDQLVHHRLIVPTRRLAEELEYDWGQVQFARGQLAWPMLRIEPWPRWLEEACNRISSHPLISQTQRQYLWQRVTASILDEQHDLLSSRSVIATWLEDAEGLIVDYALGNIEGHERYLHSRQYTFVIDAMQRAKKLSQAWQRARIADLLVQPSILDQLHSTWQRDNAMWVGFELLTPLQQRVSGLTKPGETELSAPNATYCHYPMREDELDAALLSADALAGEGKRVAIIIADLARQFRGVKQRIRLLGLDESTFHISASAALAEFPLVRSLLRHIGVICGLERDTDTLLTWFGDELVDGASISSRLKLLNKLRAAIRANFNIESLQNWLQRTRGSDEEEIYPWMERVPQWRQQVKEQRSIVEWHEWIESLLVESSWGRGAVLDSAAKQALDAFHQQLRALVDIDLTNERFDGSAYMALLTKHLNSQPFQPKSDAALVNISGWRDVAGLCFNKVFVLEQHSISWPPPQSPNAILPLGLQKEYSMNGLGEDADIGEAESMQALLRRLYDTGAGIEFSYSLIGDEEERSSAYQLNRLFGPARAAQFERPEGSGANVHYLEDDALPISADEGARGVYTLQHMFDCPFIALAEDRLGLERIERVRKGLDGHLLGKLADRTMQYLVPRKQQLGDEAFDETAALAYVEQQLRALLSDQLGYVSDRQIRQISQRLLQQALSWIDQFDSPQVTGYEAEVSVTGNIGALSLSGRIDRRDSVNGKRRIIDYKSGRSHYTRSMWNADRLSQLQPPIYALLAQEMAQRTDIIGIAHINLETTDWYPAEIDDALIAEYERIIAQLANHFVEGVYPLAPRKKDNCKYCAYKLLCRRDLWLQEKEVEA